MAPSTAPLDHIPLYGRVLTSACLKLDVVIDNLFKISPCILQKCPPKQKVLIVSYNLNTLILGRGV